MNKQYKIEAWRQGEDGAEQCYTTDRDATSFVVFAIPSDPSDPLNGRSFGTLAEANEAIASVGGERPSSLDLP